MAGLYCDITLLASVGKETATNTISRHAILYSSSGLLFSANSQPKQALRNRLEVASTRLHRPVTHRSFERIAPPPAPGRSRRANRLLRTARRRSWPPGNRKRTRSGQHEGRKMVSWWLMCVWGWSTFMSVSRGMWSLKSSTELTRNGMWHDNTWKRTGQSQEEWDGGTCLASLLLLGLSYISQSFLSERTEGQDDTNDGHPLQNAVHSCKHIRKPLNLIQQKKKQTKVQNQ